MRRLLTILFSHGLLKSDIHAVFKKSCTRISCILSPIYKIYKVLQTVPGIVTTKGLSLLLLILQMETMEMKDIFWFLH